MSQTSDRSSSLSKETSLSTSISESESLSLSVSLSISISSWAGTQSEKVVLRFYFYFVNLYLFRRVHRQGVYQAFRISPLCQSLTRSTRKQMCFFGPPQKSLDNFKSVPKLSLVLSLKDNFLSSKLEAVFAYKRQMFLPFWAGKNDIIWGARDRLCRRKAHAI